MAIITTSVEEVAAALQQGDVAGIPTETVYGLAANALNPDAVVKIFEAKKRPAFDPLIVHIRDKNELDKYVSSVSDTAQKLADTFWPGPLTLVLPKKNIIPDLVSSGLDTVAVRVPKHPLLHSLLDVIDFPLAAPSANPFGYISPTSAQHVEAQLGNKIKYILDGGACAVGLESTILGFENEQPVLMRYGGIAIEEIEAICGKVLVRINASSNPVAPGQLLQHYSPKKPFFLGDLDYLLKKNSSKKISVISFCREVKGADVVENFVLSQQKNLPEAATHLFRFLRDADASSSDVIIAEEVPDAGLGRAINDRLRRAAANNLLPH